MPLFGDAYLADTRHLSLEEHGAYLQLLIIAWRSEGCVLPNDDARLARMLGVTAGRWAKLKPTVMAFWTLSETGWSQKRLSKEREFVEKKSAQNKAAADARWSGQDAENKQSGSCERSSERNAPSPSPPVESLEANASIASDDAPGAVIKFTGKRKADPAARAEFVEAWNDLAGALSLPQILKLTPERSRAVDLRLADYTVDDCVKVLANIRGSPFLRGETGWRGCTFDWVIKKANFQKILEGNYNGHQPVQIRRA